MDFIAEVTDLGAPEYAVTGIASIERISIGQVRVSYYSMRRDGAVIVAHVVWDMQAWLHHRRLIEEAQDIVSRLSPPYGPQQERRQERH